MTAALEFSIGQQLKIFVTRASDVGLVVAVGVVRAVPAALAAFLTRSASDVIRVQN